jgi:uncharacterized protein
MYRILLTTTALILLGIPLNRVVARGAEKLRVLIIDGNNPYHEWQVTTPLLKKILEESGRFEVDVATLPITQQPPGDALRDLSSGTPGAALGGSQTAGFRPKFSDYDVVLGNYIGPRWPAETEADFVAFVASGGGFVSVHAADNAFPDWPEYNRITGLGGWYGRNEAWGPYLYYNDDDQLVRDDQAGSGGSHGPQHEYQVRIRDPEHPITRGLPEVWMHTKDELYSKLRGTAEDVHVLATAYSAPDEEGTGRHEPVLMTVRYGKGRAFHTVLGHADYSMQCVGFITTLLRGTEWAATGEVTLPVPDDFPAADKPQARE